MEVTNEQDEKFRAMLAGFISRPNALDNKITASEKTITTKELAEVMGVDVDTVNNTVNKLGFSEVLRKSTGGRPTKCFTEAQATLIKQEIQKHHNLAERQIDNVATDFEKMFSVKEIAENIGTSYDVINNAVKRVFPEVVKNGKKTMLSKIQVTELIEELKSHTRTTEQLTFEAGSKVAKVSTELTPALKIKKAMELMREGYEEELAILRAKNAEMHPKALVYDKICNADGLKSVEQVASNLGYGKNNFFALMRGMGIFFYSSKDADGRKVNLPKREYVERGYFVTKEEPYTRGDKDCLYTKIYVTGKDETWLAKLDNIDKKEQLEILSKEVC